MNAKDGFYKIDPPIWGPTFWKHIHFIILTYDVHQKPIRDMIEMYFYSLCGLLPCPECQEHYQNYYQKNPIKNALSKKVKLWKWVYRLESEVFSRTHPNGEPWTYDVWLAHIQQEIGITETA